MSSVTMKYKLLFTYDNSKITNQQSHVDSSLNKKIKWRSTIINEYTFWFLKQLIDLPKKQTVWMPLKAA